MTNLYIKETLVSKSDDSQSGENKREEKREKTNIVHVKLPDFHHHRQKRRREARSRSHASFPT